MNLAKALSNKAIVAIMLSAIIALGMLMTSRGWLASAQTIGPLDHITLSPATVTLAPGATQQYSAQGYDANNNAVSGLTYVGTVENGGGTISTGGLFTAGQITGNFPDTVKVTTTQGEITRTAYASVTVAPAAVTPTPTPTVTTTPAPTATPSATATPGNNDDHDVNNNPGLHKRAWRWFAHKLGMRDMRSVDATITDKDGVQHKVTIDAGVVASISAPGFTITLNGATTTKSFTTDADTKFRPAAREGKKGLAGLKVSDEVVVVMMDGKVISVQLVHRLKAHVDDDDRAGKCKHDDKHKVGRPSVCPPGNYNGNLHLVGDCTINGNVNGNIKINAGTLTVKGKVNGNIEQAGAGSVVILSGASVDGNIDEKGDGGVKVEGSVNGNILEVGAGIVTITGVIDGNVSDSNDNGRGHGHDDDDDNDDDEDDD